ncbi:MAG: Zn-dependent peptidase ImmA (M78 family) [Kiritimatiellia bacterium]
MTTVYAAINPDILSWARERAQLSLAVLAQKLHVPEIKLEEWESGDKPPTFKQAQNFAAKTHTPFGYLFLRTPPIESLALPDLRTFGGNQPRKPSSELMEIIQIILRRKQWFLDYLRDQGAQHNPYIGLFNTQSSVHNIVRHMRKTLNVGAHPERGYWDEYFRLLVQKIEAAGILIMRQGDMGHYTRPLSVSEFRGFAIFDPIAPIIFINQADAPSARLFTLMHELAHIWIGESGISDANPTTQRKEEVLCNAVAGEFLVPAGEFKQYWQELENWQDNIPLLESHFHVSQWVIVRRAQSLGKITVDQYQHYINDLKDQHKNRERTKGGPTYYVTKKGQLSERFSKALVSEALSGRVLLRDAAQLLGMKASNITKYAKELDI